MLKFAKIYGYILIVLGVLGILVGFGHIYRFSTNPNYTLSSSTLPLPLIFISSVLNLIAGYGLISKKHWILYVLPILVAFDFLRYFISPTDDPFRIPGTILLVALTVYLWIKKNSFN